MDSRYNLIINELGSLRVKLDISLKDYFGSKLDFKVNSFFMATTIPELIKAVKIARELELNFLILGSGSKVALDKNFDGFVINNKSQNLKIFGVKGKVSPTGIGVEEAMIEADSGITLSKLAQYAAKQKLTGFEGLETSEGSIGGSLINNIKINQFVTQIKVLDRFDEVVNKKIEQFEPEDIILSAIFKLKAA